MDYRLCRPHLMELARATPEGAGEALLAAHALRAVVAHGRKRHGFAGEWDIFARRLAQVHGCPVCAGGECCDAEACLDAVAIMVAQTNAALGDWEEVSARRPMVLYDEDGNADVFLKLAYTPPAPTELAWITGGLYN
jgi:hypothetical protein